MGEEKFPFVKNKNIKYLWCKSEYPSYEWNLKIFLRNSLIKG